jgi:hypothetical protein
MPVPNPSFRERSYALGWIRTQLPGAVGVMGDNGRILPVPQLPVLGRGATPRLALFHQGATVGYFPSFYLFPETESAVVVLTSSIANCDAADWIAQVTIQNFSMISSLWTLYRRPRGTPGHVLRHIPTCRMLYSRIGSLDHHQIFSTNTVVIITMQLVYSLYACAATLTRSRASSYFSKGKRTRHITFATFAATHSNGP